jgi:hypothetical protein
MSPSPGDIDKRFDYHEPTEEKALLHDLVRASYKRLATNLSDGLPESRERSLALTALEESLFWANASIARNDLPDPD